MRLFDETTMNLEGAVNWDPNTVLGRALTSESWLNISEAEKNEWLNQMNSPTNENTFVSKLLDFRCFLLVIIRGPEVLAKFVHLDNFQRFLEGPIFEGPLNWPDN